MKGVQPLCGASLYKTLLSTPQGWSSAVYNYKRNYLKLTLYLLRRTKYFLSLVSFNCRTSSELMLNTAYGFTLFWPSPTDTYNTQCCVKIIDLKYWGYFPRNSDFSSLAVLFKASNYCSQRYYQVDYKKSICTQCKYPWICTNSLSHKWVLEWKMETFIYI